MKCDVLQVDVMVSSVDQIDQEDLSCILGQEPAPLQLQLPRLRRLLSLSDQFVALVDDPDKVMPFTLSALSLQHMPGIYPAHLLQRSEDKPEALHASWLCQRCPWFCLVTHGHGMVTRLLTGCAGSCQCSSTRMTGRTSPRSWTTPF